MKQLTKQELLDCTIRDGGYVNNWDFDKKLVRETYRALSKAGVDYVELGYHGSEKYFDKDKFGAFRFCAVDDIREVCRGIEGADIALMVDYGKFDLADLAQYKGTPVKLIRLAFHKDKLKEALAEAGKIKQLGFKVSVNFMGFAAYTEEDKKVMMSLLKDLPLDYAYVADTYGSMFPDQMADFFRPLLEIKHIKWGFHPHNNLQMAFANSLAAIEAGAQIVDGSVFGMGRGAGNLPTECMLAYLHTLKPEKYNVIPVLNLIDRYFTELHRKHGWGYNLPYMLSGTYGCHPNFAKNLVERKEYDIEDIWNILEVIKTNNPVGFRKELVDDILKKGFFGKRQVHAYEKSAAAAFNNNQVEVKYANRYPGRDFLVLATGPSLKQNQKEIEDFIKRYDPIILGANYLGGLFKPHYHAFTNKRRFTDYVDTVDKDAKLLVGQYISQDMIKEYLSREYETLYYEDTLSNPFDIKNGVISANCRTISVLLAAVA
ncbi:MAG: aldolase catalytic domain-containing protein, partial [Candidatus Margulisbacteria bacterium]|nr:aldolase catalytic domain-containing protein [Candidatus Margulisiibacteriota bacterium]